MLYEVMAYMVITNHAALEFVVVINQALWNELSEGERSIIATAAAEVEHDLRMSYRRINQETLDWIAANTAMKVRDLNAEQRFAWREAAKPVYDSYIQRTGQIGEELLTEAQKLQ
jgi:C4-dicarboxylate-binding protein DctP